ncbi:Cobyrinic acid a,c-diamide synthase [Desulforamulus reducens MI-1]|uniref:Cobyrinic acid a,c-diamide synthase n=1 Tax=Desulforamulus reducens (strain ATCC BAA-1160 / DSM 100696 / MI-1) TaxID=349161 RepID=A4J6N2_DESRM|nr:ATP-binding protein [Desulforamulus reducens]ABO50735.1 Cobyrinic acid a,c-diamide synthase [Desulforamulus reducens MI-1]
MKIAVLSGKGGTGKTTISASFAASIASCQYIDCDVEEPNGYIFLNPDIQRSQQVKVLVPEVDKAKCDGCGACGTACQFNAIAVLKGEVLLFHEICHHCGACVIACPRDAIYEQERMIGVIEANKNDNFLHGKLNVGEPISVPIIQELKNLIKKDKPVIIDCSPGASCAVVQSIEECDYCVLVTEPTPFGLHDLEIAVQLVRKMKMPFGIIINKASDDSKLIHDYCRSEGIKILMEIPFSTEIAKAYSEGILPIQKDIVLKQKFEKLYEKLVRGEYQ